MACKFQTFGLLAMISSIDPYCRTKLSPLAGPTPSSTHVPLHNTEAQRYMYSCTFHSLFIVPCSLFTVSDSCSPPFPTLFLVCCYSRSLLLICHSHSPFAIIHIPCFWFTIAIILVSHFSFAIICISHFLFYSHHSCTPVSHSPFTIIHVLHSHSP